MILEVFVPVLSAVAVVAAGFLMLRVAGGWQPIEEWCDVLRRSATTWVTGAVNSIVAIVGVHWAVLLGVLPFVPFWLQLPLALIVAAVVTAPTIIARLTKQPKLESKIKEKRNVASKPVQQ